jgi:hypothetical protein
MGKTKVQFFYPEKEENIIVLWLDRTYTVAKAERNRAEEQRLDGTIEIEVRGMLEQSVRET